MEHLTQPFIERRWIEICNKIATSWSCIAFSPLSFLSPPTCLQLRLIHEAKIRILSTPPNISKLSLIVPAAASVTCCLSQRSLLMSVGKFLRLRTILRRQTQTHGWFRPRGCGRSYSSFSSEAQWILSKTLHSIITPRCASSFFQRFSSLIPLWLNVFLQGPSCTRAWSCLRLSQIGSVVRDCPLTTYTGF